MTATAAAAATRVPAPWLALLAAPLSFGITGPTLLLGEIAGDLGVRSTAATWVVIAFGGSIAIGTPLIGALLGRHGLRAALATCAALVLTGAILVLTVPVLPALVLGSVLQALGTAGFSTTAMSLAGSAGAMGVVTASLASVGATGPLVGSAVGALTSWQVALALPVLSLLALPAVAGRGPSVPLSGERFDAIGAALLTGLVAGVVFIPHYPLPGALAAVLAASLLVWHLRARPDGFVPAALLRSGVFVGSSLLALALAITNFGLIFVLPELLSSRAGWTAGQIGTGLLWPLLLGGTLSWLLVATSSRVGARPVIAALIAGGLGAAALAAVSPGAVLLLVAMFIGSLSAATGQGVLAVRASAAAPDRLVPAAIGLFNLCYLLGSAVGPAIAALLVAS